MTGELHNGEPGNEIQMAELNDYRDVSIRLTDERRRHVLGHPEMAGMENALGDTLANPELVVRSLSDPDATLYYRLMRGTLFGDKWLCVVVKYDGSSNLVLTAYLTDRPKKGERLWPAK